MTLPRFLDGTNEPSGPTILAGIETPLDGTPFAFKSFHPLAEKGLILRPATEGSVVSWTTSELRYEKDSSVARFVWIASCANGTGANDRSLTLSANGSPWFRFRIRSRVETPGWSAQGPKGTTLTFERRWKDWAGDDYGYMSLEIPRGVLPEGQKLVLRLEGDEGDARDWFNVFTYSLAERVEVKGHPALVRGARGTRQLIGVFVDHISMQSPVEVRTGLGEILHAVADFGYNVYTIEVPPARSEMRTEVTVAVGGKTLFEGPVTLRAVRERVFYLLPHSHNDVGYSDHQEAMLRKQFTNIETALDLIDKTSAYPPEAQFKWNVEILWTVEQWLAKATSEQRERFKKAVRARRMGLDALFGNMLTGICRPEELLRMTHYARVLGRELGVPVTSAMSGDIPGFIWGIVPALAQSGVRCFSSGPNYQPFLPDTGDRVGHSNRAWCDRPFYWIAPSGKEKVFFWMAGKGYSWFHDWILGRARHELAHHFYGYMRELEESAYPYDIVQLRYTVGADNGPTDPGLPDFVREWNERHITPRFVISTTAEMFEEFERRYGTSIPSFAGELTPYWEDGVLSSLRELGIAREASQRLVQAETLGSIIGPTPGEQEIADSAWRQITLFEEHTWGAYNSITDPDSEFALSQWDVKRSFATEADRQSRALLQQVVARRSGEALSDAVDVMNTCSWARTGLVAVPADRVRGMLGLKDQDGNPVAVQWLSTGEMAFLAENIPPLGMKRFYLDKKAFTNGGRVRVDGWKMGNGEVTVEVDPATGALRSFKDLVQGVELVDGKSGLGINDLRYVPGLDPARNIGCRSSSLVVKESGPLAAVLEVSSDAPGCTSFVRRITLVDRQPTVEIENFLVRKCVRTKEALHFAFPFRIPNGNIVLDGGYGAVRPETDQLAGACKDFFYAQRWVDVSNENVGCTLAIVESPIVEIGSMTSEVKTNNGYRKWRTEVDESTTVFSYVMNNYWHTNYKADQEGPATVRYGLMPHGKRDFSDCARYGFEFQRPLLLFPAKGPILQSMLSLMSADQPGQPAKHVIIPWIDISRDGKALMLRLLNVGGVQERVVPQWGRFQPTRVFESSPLEEVGKNAEAEIVIGPWEFKTLRCTLH
jgi:alpha-mannosidase